MKALRFDGKRVALVECPEPLALPGDVVVSVVRAGICATDLEIAKGYMGFVGVLGHELLGKVEGRRVVSDINFACGHCTTCRRREPHHCPHRTVLGIQKRDGALAERVAVPVAALHSVPDSVSDDAAQFAEPLAAALHVLDDVSPKRQDKVAVVGDGKLGLLVAMVLATTSAETTILGHHLDHLQIVHPLGVRTALEEPGKPLGLGKFDVVVEATGSPSGLARALELVRPRGTIVLKSTYAGTPAVALAPIVIDEIRVVGSRCGDLGRAIDVLAEGAVDPRPLLQHVLPLAKAEEAFDLAGRPGVLKVAVAPELGGR